MKKLITESIYTCPDCAQSFSFEPTDINSSSGIPVVVCPNCSKELEIILSEIKYRYVDGE